MIILSLIICGILLGLMLFAISRGAPGGGGIGLGLIGLVGPFFILFQSLPIALFSVFLLLFGIFSAVRLPAPSTSRRVVFGGLAVAFFVAGIASAAMAYKTGQLQQKYPLMSLADRLPKPTAMETVKLSSAADQRLQVVEHLSQRENWWDQRRTSALANIHAGFVHRFIRAEGFGVGRMTHTSEYDIERLKPQPEIHVQQRTRPRENMNASDALLTSVSGEHVGATGIASPAESGLNFRNPLIEWNQHAEAIVDFSNSGGFGYFVDQDHVVGFQSHGFRDAEWSRLNSGLDQPARLVQFQLVSLLRHDVPRVYESDTLPKMDHLGEAATRPLSSFERQALQQIRGGEDLVSASTKRSLYLMGSLRAAETCAQCHGVTRGTLLGAFSYEWEIEPAAAEPKSDENVAAAQPPAE